MLTSAPVRRETSASHESWPVDASAASEQHIQTMRCLIARARAAGHPAEEAVALLDSMIELQRSLREVRQKVQARPGSPPASP